MTFMIQWIKLLCSDKSTQLRNFVASVRLFVADFIEDIAPIQDKFMFFMIF